MAKKPVEAPEKNELSAAEADQLRDNALRNMLRAKPKPQKNMKVGRKRPKKLRPV